MPQALRLSEEGILTAMIDESGNRYGRLTITGLSEKQPGRKLYWLCKCDCGNISDVRGDHLRAGTVKSCGCLCVDHCRKGLAATHGEARDRGPTAEYRIWAGMLGRCVNPRRPEFKNYGGRGISVCVRWRKYENFLADMGRCNGLTIDRIDSDGNYEPGNCRWATLTEQARNRRTNKLTYADIPEIKKLVASGMTQVAVGELYGVYGSHISRVVNGKRWVGAWKGEVGMKRLCAICAERPHDHWAVIDGKGVPVCKVCDDEHPRESHTRRGDGEHREQR